MKIIVAGSREINDNGAVAKAIQSSPYTITEIVSGAARGVDSCAEVYANANNLSLKKFPADWDKYGKPAGAIRNKQMADYADGLVVVWDGKSPGTRIMIQMMNKAGKPVHLWLV